MPTGAKRSGVVCAALAAALLLAASGCGSGGAGPGDEIDGTVSRVVDGDTIVANLGSREERVRYIGIDTPESVKPNAKVDCFGPEASKENERLLPSGSPIRVVVGAEPRDRYGRLLAYVYRKDQAGQELFVNADLVRRGFADTIVFPPNTRHAGEFAELRTRARRAELGLWQRCR
ncbi:MAG: thermonuclease family protein [Solirubrobacteraceae bacterium]|nr:thermonuclease family protein [Solirubrobacteraceae bacterium]MDP5033453.1 thermonuclease family protein [Solirubrobacteraceae bacterium]